MNEIITHRPKKELQADHAWRLFTSLQEMIQFADYKVYLLYMIAGIVLSIIFSEYKELATLNPLFKACFAMLLVVSGLLIYFSMKTMMPRSHNDHHTQTKKLIYFMDIASQQDKDFVGRFLELPTDQITEDLLNQAAILSDILKQKFMNLKRAMWAFYGILFIVLVMQILKIAM